MLHIFKKLFLGLLIVINTTLAINSTIPVNNQQLVIMGQTLSLDMFNPTFISVGYFSAIAVTYGVLYLTKYRRELKKDVHLLGYHSMITISFLTLFTLWWTIMFIYSFLTSNIGDILFRLGVWIIINMYFILLPITRTNIFIKLFGITHSDIVFAHGYIALLCIIAVIVKFITVLIYFQPSFLIVILNTKTGGSPLAGTLATFAMIMTGLISVPIIRKNWYELFYYTHRTLVIIALATSVWHYFISLYYLLPAIILYIVDIILRYSFTQRGLYLKLNNIGNDLYKTSCIIITVKLKKFIHIPPGSYFLICIRNISSLEWHPFSLVRHSNNTLIFCAKDLGDNTWTGKLKKLVVTKRDNINKEIYIQGPYNYFDINHILSIYTTILCIAGGIGITPILSMLKHVSELYYLKKIDKKIKIIFVWSITHVSLLEYFNDNIIDLNHHIIDIEIYVTKQEINLENYPNYIHLNRPNIDNIVIEKKTDNMCIVGCGSNSIISDIKAICIKFNIDNFCEEF